MSMAPQLHTTFAYCLWFLTRLLICSTAVVGGASAQHAVVQTLDRSLAAFEIQGGIQALTEIGPGIGIAAIASGARGAFKTVPADTVFSLTENHTLWIHLRFASTAAQRTDWTVSIPLPHLDHVMVYLRNETGH